MLFTVVGTHAGPCHATCQQEGQNNSSCSAISPHVTFLHPSMNMEHLHMPRGFPAGRTEPNQDKHQGGPIEIGNLPVSWFFFRSFIHSAKRFWVSHPDARGRQLRRYHPLSPPWAPEKDPISKIKKERGGGGRGHRRRHGEFRWVNKQGSLR